MAPTLAAEGRGGALGGEGPTTQRPRGVTGDLTRQWAVGPANLIVEILKSHLEIENIKSY